MRDLVYAYRNILRTVDDYVGSLQKRISKEAVIGKVPVLQFLLFLFISRHSLEPAQGRYHRKKQMQFRMLQYSRLEKYGAFIRIKPCCQKIYQKVIYRIMQRRRIFISCCKGMPVSNKIIAVIFILELHPILKRSDEITYVDLAA